MVDRGPKASANTLRAPERGTQGRESSVRPPSFLRVRERASAALEVASGANLPPARRTLIRKYRSGDKQGPLERVMALAVELHGCGVSIAALRRWPQAISDLLDDLSCGVATPRIDAATLTLEGELEAEENSATLRILLGDRSPEALDAYADSLEAEAHHQLELSRAARKEARDARRSA